MELSQKSIGLEAETWVRLDAEAKSKGQKMAAWLRQILKERYEKQDAAKAKAAAK